MSHACHRCWKCHKTRTFCPLLAGCRIPCACHTKPHPENGVLCTIWLLNVLRATTVCTFATSQLPKAVRTWGVLYILTSKRASRHNNVHFLNISTIYMSAEPDVCPEPTPVAQNDYFFQRAPTKSAKGCCRRELLRNHKRGILQSDSIVLPVYILVLGGGRFRPFLPIVLELFYPSTYFFGSGRFRPFVYYVVLESKPIIIDLLRTAWGGWKIYTLCVCVQIKSVIVPFYILLQGCGKILHVVMLFAPKLKRHVKMVVKGWANLRFGRCVSDL